jgi:hypothetical protein
MNLNTQQYPLPLVVDFIFSFYHGTSVAGAGFHFKLKISTMYSIVVPWPFQLGRIIN